MKTIGIIGRSLVLAPRWVAAGLVLSGALVMSACGLEPGDGYDAKAVEAFDYSNFTRVPLSMHMTDTEGQDLLGVQVTVRRASALPFDDPEYVPGEVLFRGRTGLDGKINMPTTFPAGMGDVEVVSHLRGYQGKFSEPKMLEDWGAFAPSSIVKLSADELGNFNLLLAEKL